MKRPVVRVAFPKRTGYPYGGERAPDTIIQLGRVPLRRPRAGRRARPVVRVALPKRSGYPYGIERDADDTIS